MFEVSQQEAQKVLFEEEPFQKDEENEENENIKNTSLSQIIEDVEGTIIVSITNTEKHGEGMNAFVTYSINTKCIDDPILGTKDINANRRYSDFVWLHDTLKTQYKGVIIPPLPEKNLINRFSPDVIDYRKSELERFLKRVLTHPKLVSSPHVLAFLENGELQKAPEDIATKSKGFFSTLTEKVTNINIGTVVETDEWFTDIKEYIKGLDLQLNNFYNKTTSLTKKRKEFVQIWEDFSQGATEYANVEIEKDKMLHRLFDKLGEITHQISSLHNETVEREVSQFESSLKDYIRTTAAVKDVLTNRDNALLKYQAAEKTLEQKKQKSEKNASASKASAIQTEVNEAEKQKDTAKAQFEEITRECKEEIDKFLKTKNKEITDALRDLVQTNMNHELRVLDLWKELLQLIEESPIS
eukprot:TRINITY_DN8158_c0_g1_i1.p1 TRINITY_DN8158_c0_g1~~TRINITY_DN8158_c0_g1_i1.p1  ORF type:complete len:449 (+),score=116.58 TRINITY_DN8158_c0_g1_i1:110-1348(+)